MRSTNYKLKQEQYARVYRVAERTVRRWMKQNAPLDQPDSQRAWLFLHKQTLPPSWTTLTDADIRRAYAREHEPAALDNAVRCELAARIAEADAALWQVATFAYAHRGHLQLANEIIAAAKKTKSAAFDILKLVEPIPLGVEWPPRSEDLQQPVYNLAGPEEEDIPEFAESDPRLLG